MDGEINFDATFRGPKCKFYHQQYPEHPEIGGEVAHGCESSGFTRMIEMVRNRGGFSGSKDVKTQ